jgi:hypothetical protein
MLGIPARLTRVAGIQLANKRKLAITTNMCVDMSFSASYNIQQMLVVLIDC